ncbi:MAG: nitrilase-related carbon-nitrogen hydrolase [Desulfobacterales bacterium]
MKNTRIAMVVSRSAMGNIDENLKGMENWVKRAKKKDVRLVCFPEMNITGYSTRSDIRDIAECIPGKATARVSELARRFGVVILAGMAEKGDNHDIFASHIVFEPDGRLDVYRKLHIAPPEKSIYSPGDAIPVFQTSGITFGIQLCYDAHFPELTTRLAEKGAELIFMPHASPRGTPRIKRTSWMRHLPARAYDNSIFVAAANQTGMNGSGLVFPGLAMVIAPSGQLLSEKFCNGEGMLVVGPLRR